MRAGAGIADSKTGHKMPRSYPSDLALKARSVDEVEIDRVVVAGGDADELIDRKAAAAQRLHDAAIGAGARTQRIDRDNRTEGGSFAGRVDLDQVEGRRGLERVERRGRLQLVGVTARQARKGRLRPSSARSGGKGQHEGKGGYGFHNGFFQCGVTRFGRFRRVTIPGNARAGQEFPRPMHPARAASSAHIQAIFRQTAASVQFQFLSR
jgi:hypothetical protein